ncbi:MAG: hypothetical protein GTO53_03085 [Planctomycetales bacterium]|nr:hypothetical protein [Planctomycetales bacterium]NIM08152.1 hypothetical protein [Planctomycetales bacterium]NIN07644.1 hypothetical protein [Planctomycetales bacterium]NIN76761.1 hypothetical protein [Planctomycetales bacterium]NIO33970.1 hypothetical protein [Planctomycetales bacterium]
MWPEHGCRPLYATDRQTPAAGAVGVTLASRQVVYLRPPNLKKNAQRPGPADHSGPEWSRF